ncbi:MAG: HAD-IIA family hydrolase [Thermoproteota archaeon]
MKERDLLRKLCLFLVDVDGVLVKGRTPIPGAAQAVEKLRRNGGKVIFVTNNASRSREMLSRELNEIGIESRPEETLTTAHLAARYLVAHKARTVFMVGEKGLRDELLGGGLEIVGGDAERCDAVVVGIDREFTYRKMADASRFIRQGARFIATNTDATLPTEGGEIPGAGAIVSSIVTCTRRRPTVLGKPNPSLVKAALQADRCTIRQTAVVGDRAETDVAMARRAGCVGILLLTGVSTHTRCDDYARRQRPNMIFPSLQALANAYEEAKKGD